MLRKGALLLWHADVLIRATDNVNSMEVEGEHSKEVHNSDGKGEVRGSLLKENTFGQMPRETENPRGRASLAERSKHKGSGVSKALFFK